MSSIGQNGLYQGPEELAEALTYPLDEHYEAWQKDLGTSRITPLFLVLGGLGHKISLPDIIIATHNDRNRYRRDSHSLSRPHVRGPGAMAETRVNEFTPLLVTDDAFRPPTRRRSVWQYVLAGALSLGVLSLFQQQDAPSLNVADVAVSLDETPDADDAAFLSSMETFKDPSVDPFFFEYACGGWLKSHEIPSKP
ncbi:unnamed protein product [Phytophthora lilii]|uniref:Unnamed protein product n=1 Tax=Phytophthora lilii TaxID=2077276 RepID=A0A9W6TQG7_9STRA|nr:unnamed protein product [Phytophthora lilii]